MFRSLHARQREEEWMDALNVDPNQLRGSLVFIQRINRFLGYTRATVGYLKRFSESWKAGEKIIILDVATGSGDIPRAIFAWAHRRNFAVQIAAVDLHPNTIRVAAEQTPGLKVTRADARTLPFADKSFDYVHTAMFLHHLDEQDVVEVLKEMNRVARRGIIIADLLRHRRAYLWISFFTLLSSSIIRHDARVSVAQAFTKEEILKLCEMAGLGDVAYRQHPGYRFVVSKIIPQ